MRWLVVLALGTLGGCVISSGPDCNAACEQALACPDLDKTFRLNCSSVSQACVNEAAVCAECILRSNCADLESGLCDAPCGPTQQPLLLPLEEARPLPDPRLQLPAP